MYPYIRMALEAVARARRACRRLGLLDTACVAGIVPGPGILTLGYELNNGRTLTLYRSGPDSGLSAPDGVRPRTGSGQGLGDDGGRINSTRYRRGSPVFQRSDACVSRVALAGTRRFVYMEQSDVEGGRSAPSMCLRSARAIKKPGGHRGRRHAVLVAALGMRAESPALPDWVQAWIAAEVTRGPGRPLCRMPPLSGGAVLRLSRASCQGFLRLGSPV